MLLSQVGTQSNIRDFDESNISISNGYVYQLKREKTDTMSDIGLNFY